MVLDHAYVMKGKMLFNSVKQCFLAQFIPPLKGFVFFCRGLSKITGNLITHFSTLNALSMELVSCKHGHTNTHTENKKKQKVETQSRAAIPKGINTPILKRHHAWKLQALTTSPCGKIQKKSNITLTHTLQCTYVCADELHFTWTGSGYDIMHYFKRKWNRYVY